MQRKYFIEGLPRWASGSEVGEFFSHFGPVASFHRCQCQSQGARSNDWLVEMKTDAGARAVRMLNGEGYFATAVWKKPRLVNSRS